MRKGFSLVELSVVLVILGLLVGGILSGQSLIRASSIRSLTTDAERYYSAIMSFQDQYNAIPGDMNNAVRYWGPAAGSLSDGTDSFCLAVTAAATDKRTCNGNGDGLVSMAEGFRGWQHLANAGLIEGTYAGVADPDGASRALPGFNVPQMKVSLVGATLFTITNRTTEGGSWFKTSQRLLLSIGRAFSNNETRVGFLSPDEAWNIDTKIDDGKPSYGRMQSRNDTGCTTTGITETAEYALGGGGSDCIIRYFMD